MPVSNIIYKVLVYIALEKFFKTITIAGGLPAKY